MVRIKTCSIFLLLSLWSTSYGQVDSAIITKPKIAISGFVDVFYCYDFNKPETHRRQDFLYNHNRHNEVNINLALIKFAITQPKYRANIALHTGTYVEDNYSNEPVALRHIYEANIGVALAKNSKLWLDAGIFPSHIGFESAISKDSWTLTRSMLAENSPYYLTGAKITYSPKAQWEIAGIVCNGWQVIQRPYGDPSLSGGTQVKFTPNKKYTFNWSTYVGEEKIGTRMIMRYFSNLFAQMQLTDKLGATIGFDFGVQQEHPDSNTYQNWMSPIAIVRYSVNSKMAIALRGEYYQDQNSTIVSTATGSFNTMGVSLNIDYSPAENVLFRIEGRWFKDQDKIFVRNNSLVNTNSFVTSSIALSF